MGTVRVVIECEPHDGARNMALDEALLESAAGRGLVTVRVYGWRSACITIGRFQSVRRTLPAGSLQSAVPIARRITGGRAILHGSDVTLAVATPTDRIGLSDARDVMGLYARLVGPIAQALTSLGVPVASGSGRGDHNGGGDCFDCAEIGRAHV